MKSASVRSGVCLRKAKAHATATEIMRGLFPLWKRAANYRADELAKLGAALHPGDPALMEALEVYDLHVGCVLVNLASVTARLGKGAIPRDCIGSRQKRSGCRPLGTPMLPVSRCWKGWPLDCFLLWSRRSPFPTASGRGRPRATPRATILFSSGRVAARVLVRPRAS